MTVRALTLCALLLVSASALEAQAAALHPGDTVRVWRHGSAAAFQDYVVAVTADSLILRTRALAFADARHVDVARGKTFNRGRMAVFVVAGLVPGAVLGNALSPHPCDTCVLNPVNLTQLGAAMGAGIGYLLARKFAMQPTWYTAWPRPAEPAIAARPIADSARRVIQPGLFSFIESGSLIRVWVRDSGVTQGKYGSVSSDQSSMLWLDRPNVTPLRSIDALETGSRHPVRWTFIGAAVVSAPVVLLAGVACALEQCNGDRVGLVIGTSAVIGGVIGAVVGTNRVSWQLRFSR